MAGALYVYTLIDLFSRAAYAEYSPKCNHQASFHFVMRGQDYLDISLAMLQTDNGPEFGKWFHDQLNSKGIALRHSRVRMPILRDSIILSRRNTYLQIYVHQLCRKGFIGISHTTTSSGDTQALMEISA